MGKKKVTGKDRDWIAIRNEYTSTGCSLRDLCKKYSIPFSTIRDRSRREEWTKLKTEQRHIIEAETARKTADRISDENADRTARLLNIADRLMDRVEQALDELDRAEVRHKATVRTIVDSKDPETKQKQRVETSKETIDLDIRDAPVDRLGLQQIATAAKSVKEILATAQGTDDTGSLDDLIAALKQIGGADQ